ncbi:hypothetical protein [Bdellovibrio svalbardensis]|uniref:Nuclear transport factor 2 family protein n=1 Tax=Bdellovibrio svalbardensis TaxID=2972972 RepID=A0ABT6DMM7_9BACT|nr:hypothetical protein [Bdellovibrio svalbardensis]MDG0818129.1 hypothetical protein [Bdellovibrio svalbardensis]
MRTSSGKFLALLLLGLLNLAHAQAQTLINVGSTPLQVSTSISPAIPDEDLKAIGELLHQFTTTLSAQDFNAHLKLYHFPNARFTKGKVSYFRKVKDLPSNDLRVGLSGDFKSSDWASLEIIQAGADKVHVITILRRLRKDGSEINRTSGLYILEKIKNQWGIRGSSVF